MASRAQIEQEKTKFRIIYIPFLGISAAFIIVYSILNWLLVMKWGILPLSESVANMWLPYALPWIPVYFILHPRQQALRLRGINRDWGFMFAAAFAIAVPTMIAQEYLTTATGNLTSLDRISEIGSKDLSKYYVVGRMFADKRLQGAAGSVEPSGSNDESLIITICFVCPLRDGIDAYDPLDRGIWLGVRYSEIIGRRASKGRLEEIYKDYAKTCTTIFKDADLRNFTYFERATNNDDRRLFESAVKNSGCAPGSRTPVILIAHDDPFETRSGAKLPWIFWTFAIGAGIFGFMLLFPSVDEKEVHHILSGRRPKKRNLAAGLHYFLPRPGMFVTPILMDVNILVFALMVLSGLGVKSFSTEDLVKWGADYGPLVWNGEYWRIVTSMFVHAGLMHLAGNLYGLIFAGFFLERIVPRSVFAFTYFISGICASLASITTNAATVSVGASGAIFGLYGLLLFLLLTNERRVKFARNPLLISALVFVGFNLFSGLMTEGVDNAAHFGGLLAGAGLGVIFHLSPYSALSGRTITRKKSPLSSISGLDS